MTELTEESKALIEAEAPLDEATAPELEAMRVRVLAVLGAVQPAPAPHPLAAKTTLATSLKVAGSVVVAAVGSAALLFAVTDPPAPRVVPPAPTYSVLVPPPPALPPAPSSATPSASTEPAASAPLAAPRILRPEEPSVPAPSASSASEEALLVATAEAQLRGGHPGAALALYEQHLQRYPKGNLRQESSAGRVVALCALGRSGEARVELDRFAARHPGSPSLLRMQRACGVQP